MSLNRKIFGLFLMLGMTAMAFGFQPDEKQGQADIKAAALAAQTLMAMGGHANYEATRYISWNFFGSRHHIWDKWTGDYRLQDQKGRLIIMNINSREGQVWENNEAITDPEKLKEHLQAGYKIWINDSYWLVMPYKLRDPGVTLTYEREDQSEDGRAVDVLALTFEAVGVTPQNKYEVFIDKQTQLISQWNFFTNAEDAEPRFKTPWADWQTYGAIKLSGDRGRSKLSEIAVHQQVPEHTFKTSAPVVFPQ